MQAANVVIFGRDTCPYCQHSKATADCLKQDRRIASFDFKTLDEKNHTHKKQTAGYQTVPQVFIDGNFIGGNAQFQAWATENFGEPCKKIS